MTQLPIVKTLQLNFSLKNNRGCAHDITTRKWAWHVEGKKGVYLWENSTGGWFGACFQMIDKRKIVHAAVCQATNSYTRSPQPVCYDKACNP